MVWTKKRIALITFLTLFLTLIGCRNILISIYARHKIVGLEKRFDLKIDYKTLKLGGLSHFIVRDLTVIPSSKDTLLYLGESDIRLAFLPLLVGKIEVKNWSASNIQMTFIKGNESSNFEFLFHSFHKESVQTEKENKHDFDKKINKTLSLLFRLLPSNADLNNIEINYKSPQDNLQLSIPHFNLTDNRFSTIIHTNENSSHNDWIANGILNDSNHEIEAHIKPYENSKVVLPFINYRWNAYLAFDSLSFRFEAQKNNQQILGKAVVDGLALHQERISPDTVDLNKINIDFVMNAGENYIELDSASKILFNDISFNPYLKLQKDEEWHIEAILDKDWFPAQQLFSSLPEGLFQNLRGIETLGELSYHFLTDIDFANLDSLILESDLKARNFRILSYGNSDLTKMNDSFQYTAYENGVAVKTFELGASNPMFRPLTSISRYLPLAIMQSEDAGFYQHGGFILSAIRESLIKDLKEKRFARGGSTISMQLVKNVFLSRNKTISRKLEEMLIVWLIEHNRITSKERMMEVYLNIIEWGPMVYGASEASRFYFDKEAADLTLEESIFLASLVPKPKHFLNSFDGDKLRASNEAFFNIIADRLIQRNLISIEESFNLSPYNIKFNGGVRNYIGIEETSFK